MECEVSPCDAEAFVDALLREGYVIPGLNSSEVAEGALMDGVPLFAIDREGRVHFLPLYVVREISERIFKEKYVLFDFPFTISFTGEVISSRRVSIDDERAIESSISLADLIRHLEGEGEGRSEVIIGLFISEVRTDLCPTIKETESAIQFLRDRLSGNLHYYDFLCVGTDRPNKVLFRETLYPIPPFLKSIYDLDIESEYVSVIDFIKLFLDGRYADRVIILPRVRFRKGNLQTEFFYLGKFLRRAFLRKGGESRRYPGSLLDLLAVSNEELKNIGIPVYRREV